MGTPTIQKTYGYGMNQRITASTVVQENKDTLLALMASLKGTGLTLYQAGGGGPAYTGTAMNVRSASNGTAAGNNDNTERIAARADLVWATSGTAHSWWHAQWGSSGIHVLLDWNTGATDGSTMAVYISVNGFGTANGGTNGTTTNRPTATDECCISPTAGTAVQWTKTTSEDRILSVMMSSDGEVIRAFVRSGASAQYVWSLDIEKGAPFLDPMWNKPWFGRSYYSAGGVFVNTVMGNSTAATHFGMKNGGGRFIAGMPSIGYSNQLLINANAGSEGYAGGFLETPHWVACPTAGADIGYRSGRYDAWYVPTGKADGDHAPSAATTRTHLVAGDVLYPNDGSQQDLV